MQAVITTTARVTLPAIGIGTLTAILTLPPGPSAPGSGFCGCPAA